MKENSSKRRKDALKYVGSEFVSYVPFVRLFNVYARNRHLPKDGKSKSTGKRVIEFFANNPEVPLFVYDVISTIGWGIGLSDPYYRELLAHRETTDRSIVPFYFPQPIGLWGFPRRSLNFFEYPGVIQGVANGIYKGIRKGAEYVRALCLLPD
jgi:hypothetical protein